MVPGPRNAVGATVALVEDAGKPLVFVINGATARARITGDTAIALSQYGKTPQDRRDIAPTRKRVSRKSLCVLPFEIDAFLNHDQELNRSDDG